MNARPLRRMITSVVPPLFTACANGDGASGTTHTLSPAPQAEGERMVDVGGYRLALRCDGQGAPARAAPTVIFENGAKRCRFDRERT